MKKLTAYDVFIGIFQNFPEGKKDFRYERDELIDFICQRRDDYSILSEFTREDIYHGFENCFWMLRWSTATPHIREVDSVAINSAFVDFKKSELFGKEGLEELAKLSKEFLGRFA